MVVVTSPRLDTISRLARIAQLTEAMLARVVRIHGLTVAEQTVLTTLRWQGPQTPSDLARVLLQTSGGVSATLNRLERGGLVERAPDPRDGRRRVVQLTVAGAEREATLFADIEAQAQSILARVPPEREAEVDRTIELLLDLLDPSRR